jgi:hypothetical protein
LNFNQVYATLTDSAFRKPKIKNKHCACERNSIYLYEKGLSLELPFLFFLFQQLTRQTYQEDYAERQRYYAYLVREFYVGKEKCENGHQHQR